MFLEAVLYFILGFLCASLIALMISPIIWNRAVVLTQHKIESSVPLTLNEIQAEKDQLRAEFAMSTRRLEINIEQLRENLAIQTIEVNQKRDQVLKLDNDNKLISKNISSLENEKISLIAQANERDSEFNGIKSSYDALNSDKNSITEELQDLRDKLADKEELVNSMQIEIAAKNTQLSTLGHTQDGITNVNENPLKIEVDKLNHDLAEQRAHNVELEAKLAGYALKMEAVAEEASDKNLKEASEVFKDDLKLKSDRINRIEKERDILVQEVKSLSAVSKEEWADERKNTVILRERINDMAAQIAILTQELEGENSPIQQMLSKDTGTKKSSKSSGTLASRIRALQETAKAN